MTHNKGYEATTKISDDDSDPGKIRFEHGATELQESDGEYSNLIASDNSSNIAIKQCSTKPQKRMTSVVTVDVSDASSTESEPVIIKHSSRYKRAKPIVIESDENEDEPLNKKRRLIVGRRPTSSDEDGDLKEEINENKIIESRFRDRSRKSTFTRNLERLQRRREGKPLLDSDEDEKEGTDASDISSNAEVKPFDGAHPTCLLLIKDTDDEGDESDSENAKSDDDDDDFIVEDDGEADVPELPTMFSMSTFQDLSHHFKVICQLFVHLAVHDPHQRLPFMKNALRKNYFSVPLGIARRKLSAMKDSLVTSSVWKPDFKDPLEAFPVFQLESLEFSAPICDACHISKRVATLRGVLSGQKYDTMTYESIGDSNDEESEMPQWSLGRFCAARAQVYHNFTHWEYILYHNLRSEVDHLKEATSQMDKHERKSKKRRAFIPASNGPSPPGDLNDADGMMDWLDGRGIIHAQWVRLKAMMERARKLEGKGKGDEAIIDVE